MLSRALLLALLALAPFTRAEIIVTPVTHHDRSHFRVQVSGTTWLYDAAGGGFASVIDADGRDWIDFKPTPLSDFPASAAAGFRGLGNLVHGGADGGCGHPGFDRCETTFEVPATLRTRSKSGLWEWTWTFHADRAEFAMLRTDESRAWWFLYEGNPHGEFTPAAHRWGVDDATPRAERPAISGQLREPLNRVWFGHAASRWRLLLEHHTEKPAIANLWWMGAEAKGQWSESRDGMVVFGFGRGTPKDGPLLRGPQRITVRFIALPLTH